MYPKAPLGMRFIACCIDLAIFGVAGLFFGLSFFQLMMLGEYLGWVSVLCLLVTLYFFFLRDARRPSFGKRACKLMVVNLDTGRPATARDSALRSLMLLLLVVLIPGVGWLVEPIITVADTNGRRLGDRAAGTQVIEVSSYAGHTTFA